MKQLDEADIAKKDDLQIQVSTYRIRVSVKLPTGVTLTDVSVRARMVTPDGTKTTIERTNLKRLFEISAWHGGFYRATVDSEFVTYVGTIEVARDGALELTNSKYLSFDIACKDGSTFKRLVINSIPHAKTTTTYLYYNPVTITQQIQAFSLERAVDVVIPVTQIDNVQLTYPNNVIEYTRDELISEADTSNDLVYVASPAPGLSKTNENPLISVKYGYDEVVLVTTKDVKTALTASRMQVERASDVAGQFNVILIEEKTLV